MTASVLLCVVIVVVNFVALSRKLIVLLVIFFTKQLPVTVNIKSVIFMHY